MACDKFRSSMRLHGGHRLTGFRVDVFCHGFFHQNKGGNPKKKDDQFIGHKKRNLHNTNTQIISFECDDFGYDYSVDNDPMDLTFGLATGSMSPKIGPASGREGKVVR